MVVPNRIGQCKGKVLLQLELHGERGTSRIDDERMQGRQDRGGAWKPKHNGRGDSKRFPQLREGACKRIRIGGLAGKFLRYDELQAGSGPLQDDASERIRVNGNANTDCHRSKKTPCSKFWIVDCGLWIGRFP